MGFLEAFWEQEATLLLLSLTCFDISLLIFTLVQFKKYRALAAVEAPKTESPKSIEALEVPRASKEKKKFSAVQVKPIYVVGSLALTLVAVSALYFHNLKNKNTKVVLKNGDEVLAVNGNSANSGKPAFKPSRSPSNTEEAPMVTLTVKSKDGTMVEKKVRAPTNPGAPKAK